MVLEEQGNCEQSCRYKSIKNMFGRVYVGSIRRFIHLLLFTPEDNDTYKAGLSVIKLDTEREVLQCSRFILSVY